MSETGYETIMKRIKDVGLGVKELLELDKIDPIKAMECGHKLIDMTIQCEHLKQLTRIADSLEKMTATRESEKHICCYCGDGFSGRFGYDQFTNKSYHFECRQADADSKQPNPNWKATYLDCHKGCGIDYEEAEKKCPCGEYDEKKAAE